MKKQLSYFLLTPFLLLAVSCNNNSMNNESSPLSNENPSSQVQDLGPVDVVVISGQSNAVGCTRSIYLPDTMGEAKYEEYIDGYPTIQIAYDCWTKDWPSADKVTFYSQNASRKNNFVKVALGQGNGQATFGPEIGIAEATHEKYANKLFLIKYACGASNLKDDWATRKSPMYGRFIDYTRITMMTGTLLTVTKSSRPVNRWRCNCCKLWAKFDERGKMECLKSTIRRTPKIALKKLPVSRK